MISFEFKGISIECTVEMEQYDYRDSNNIARTRFDRNVSVGVHFWDFAIYNDMFELAAVKSTLNFFLQAYWKRSSKQGIKIDLATALEHNHNGTLQELNLIAKQKSGIYSLEVSLTENGHRLWCIYLSAREAMMLDIVVAKVIALLTPQTVYIDK